jgi:beta-glucosidase
MRNRITPMIVLASVSSLSIAILPSLAVAAPPTPTSAPATAQSPRERVEALLAQMTLEEKLGQLTQEHGGDADPNDAAAVQWQNERDTAIRTGSLGSVLGVHGAERTNRLQRLAVEESRLHIPLIVGNDIIHGYRTILPIPLAEAATWDPDLLERAAHVAAVEAAAAGTHWTFAPMVDIARDPRWGRVAEGAGEDPYLGAAMAVARVRGFQGPDLAAPDSVLACVKHYVAYGAAEGGRDYNTVDLSEPVLRDVYLPPFRAAVRAGAGTLMSAFNDINGVPASANRFTLTHILREEWGFTGFVVSDWRSIRQLVAQGTAVDEAEAAEQALFAGVEMDMAASAYRTHLGDAVRRGRMPIAVIDEAVRRILRIKVACGLFDRPYVDATREAATMLTAEHRDVAREDARRAIVLLKNDDAVLPIRDTVKKLALIGPLADNRADPLGTWDAEGKPEDVISVREGLQQRAGTAVNVRYAKGCELNDTSTNGLAEAVELARQSDLAVLVVGEARELSGEAHCRSTLDLPGVQERLVRAVHATGVPVVVVLMNGRPLSIVWTAEHVPAIVETWHLGVECGHAIADVLFGDVNPGGKLPVTFPRSVGQIPIYYSHRNTGRPSAEDDRYTSKYLDLPSTPLFPFGYGLSYTRFEFSDLQVAPAKIGPYGEVTVSVNVKNTGERAGDEVAQLYIRDLVGSLTRPVKELKGFQRITLRPGETRTVTFQLTDAELGFHNQQMDYVVEPGKFKVWVGPNSVEGLEAEFEVGDVQP